MWSGGMDKDSLAGQVKELQRHDSNAKEQWSSYVDSLGGGMRDPMKHDAQFLQNFLTQLSSGVSFQSSAEPSNTLGDAVKMLQKRSSVFKQVWSGFCAQHGGGYNDPMKHDAAFHAKFFESLAQMAAGGGGGGMGPMMQGCGGPPAKRMRDGAWGGGGGMQSALVERVKAFQRMGAEQKELWGQYADMYLGGVRDPSRHDDNALQEFCTNHNVPSAASNGFGGGGGQGGFMPQATMDDPEKVGLVERIKSFQRQSPDNKEIWGQFCGEWRDPARHDKEKLRQFCMAHAV